MCPPRRPAGARAAAARGRLGESGAICSGQKRLQVHRGRFLSRKKPRQIHSLFCLLGFPQRTRLGPPGFSRNDAGPDAKPGRILEPFLVLPAACLKVSRLSQPHPRELSVGRPSLRPSWTWDRTTFALPQPTPRGSAFGARRQGKVHPLVPILWEEGAEGRETGELMFSVQCSSVWGCFSATSARLLQVTRASRTQGGKVCQSKTGFPRRSRTPGTDRLLGYRLKSSQAGGGGRGLLRS